MALQALMEAEARRPPALQYPPDIYFPLTDLWDVQVLPPPGRFTFPLSLKAGQRLLMWSDMDLLSPRGWIYAASMTSNKPDTGFRLEYMSPKGRRAVWELTFRDLYNQGLVGTVSPGAWAVTRWESASPPEYAAVLFPSYMVPYQPQGTFHLVNKGAEDATIYSLIVTLINLFER